MASPSLGRLLISHITLRGPEIAQLFTSIVTVPNQSYAQLVQQFVISVTPDDTLSLDEAALREALNFLLVARLIAQDGAVRQRAHFTPSPHHQYLPFVLNLLYHSTHHEEQRQQAMSLILRQLVADDVLMINIVDLRSLLERSSLREMFAWTGEKLTFWASLHHYLGVIQRFERTSTLFIVPQPQLLLMALHWAAQVVESNGSLGSYLQQIDTNLFACLTRRGRVHQGITQSLLALNHLGAITLTHEADALQSVMLSNRRISHITLNQKELI